MSSLSIGLFCLSSAVLFRALAWLRAGQIGWSLAALCAVIGFILDPRPHAEVAIWAAACLTLWVIDRTDMKADLLAAGLAGVLIGAAAPWVELITRGVLGLPPGSANMLVMLVALAVGATLAAHPGAALAALSGALPLGLYAHAAFGAAIIALALTATAARRGPVGAPLLLPIPLIAFLGGMT